MRNVTDTDIADLRAIVGEMEVRLCCCYNEGRPMPHSADALPADVAVHCDLTYVSGGHPRQALDLYLPRAVGPLPLIVWIHGGAFRMGDKGDRVPFEILEQGYAIASLNYRLSQHARFPAQIEDCKAAVRWLRAHAHSY